MPRTRKSTQVDDAPTLDLRALGDDTRESTMAIAGLGTTGRFADNPFVDILRDSFHTDNGGGNGVRENQVVGSRVVDFVAALRNAGQQLAGEEIGVRIRYAFENDDNVQVEIGDVRKVPSDGRTVTVKYVGRPRRRYMTEGQRAQAIEMGFGVVNSDSDEVQVNRKAYWTWYDGMSNGQGDV